jgi:hypothetical protein
MQTARSILRELASGRGTARRVVEGQTRLSFSEDVAKDGVRIRQNLSGRNPQGPDPSSLEPGIADCIPPRPIAARMRLPVYFDRQPGIAAEEIQHIRPGRMLAAKL